MPATPILIRAAARGGKFLGPDAGGANFYVYNATTGETYAARRHVDGDSGPAAMMTAPMLRDTPLPVDSGTAAFFIQPDIDRPCLLYIGVEGPVLYPDQAKMVTTQAWVLPGVGTGNSTDAGLVIDIPGICIHVQSSDYDGSTSTLSLNASVMMMCGCKVGAILPGMTTSPWPPSDFDVRLVVAVEGVPSPISYEIAYSGTPSVYRIAQVLPSRPRWAIITATQARMGQSGIAPALGDPPSFEKTQRVLPEWMPS